MGSVGENAGFLLFVGGVGVVGTMMAMPNGLAGKVQESWQAYLNKKSRTPLCFGKKDTAPRSEMLLVPTDEAAVTVAVAVRRAGRSRA